MPDNLDGVDLTLHHSWPSYLDATRVILEIRRQPGSVGDWVVAADECFALETILLGETLLPLAFIQLAARTALDADAALRRISA